MKKELLVAVVSAVLLIAAAVGACQKTATRETTPATPGYLTPSPAASEDLATPPLEPTVATTTPASPPATAGPVMSPPAGIRAAQPPC